MLLKFLKEPVTVIHTTSNFMLKNTNIQSEGGVGLGWHNQPSVDKSKWREKSTSGVVDPESN